MWVFLAVFLTPAVPRAETGVQVVVLPFTTTDEQLAIFGKPVADAVAGHLAEVKGARVRSASTPDARTDLIVELRVTAEKRKVRLEAQLRDPRTGETVALVAARPVALEHLDRAATRLAKKLARKLELAASRPREPHVTAPSPTPTPTPIPNPTPTPTPIDSRPTLAILAPESPITAAALGRFVEALGYRPVPSAPGSRTSIKVDVVDVEFDRAAVLSARGTVRVRLLDGNGSPFFDRTVSTDTVVGSRGDRADAVVGFMLRQAFDIVARDLRRALP